MELEFKTPYEWCLEDNVRPHDIHQWPSELEGSSEKYFFEVPISKVEFDGMLGLCGNVKLNSTPRKTPAYLEYRMYGLVPYNLSPIQKGIQFGHAVVEYSELMYGNFITSNSPFNSQHIDNYRKWAKQDKTFIILEGGTTNLGPKILGSLNKYLQAFKDNGITVADFYEPDLGDQLSAFVFLVDERVFNRELYPNFEPEPKPQGMTRHDYDWKYGEINDKNYEKWVEKIGGDKNAFLRKILPTFRLG